MLERRKRTQRSEEIGPHCAQQDPNKYQTQSCINHAPPPPLHYASIPVGYFCVVYVCRAPSSTNILHLRWAPPCTWDRALGGRPRGSIESTPGLAIRGVGEVAASMLFRDGASVSVTMPVTAPPPTSTTKRRVMGNGSSSCRMSFHHSRGRPTYRFQCGPRELSVPLDAGTR
jgi:hypothetical protein